MDVHPIKNVSIGIDPYPNLAQGWGIKELWDSCHDFRDDFHNTSIKINISMKKKLYLTDTSWFSSFSPTHFPSISIDFHEDEDFHEDLLYFNILCYQAMLCLRWSSTKRHLAIGMGTPPSLPWWHRAPFDASKMRRELKRPWRLRSIWDRAKEDQRGFSNGIFFFGFQ